MYIFTFRGRTDYNLYLQNREEKENEKYFNTYMKKALFLRALPVNLHSKCHSFFLFQGPANFARALVFHR
jgi:hypothetical protein